MKSTITVHFDVENHERISVEANEGETLLQVAHLNNIPIEGACGGSLACATCHVIVDEKNFAKMYVSDDENDMLDMAFGLSKTSRLGCQVKLTKDMDGIVIKVLSNNNNFNCCGSCA